MKHSIISATNLNCVCISVASDICLATGFSAVAVFAKWIHFTTVAQLVNLQNLRISEPKTVVISVNEIDTDELLYPASTYYATLG